LIPDAEYAPEPIPITTNTVCSSIGDKVGAGPVIPKPTGLTIGPVPAYENLEVNNSSNQDYQMVVCNTLGQEVMNLNIDARSSNTINIEALEPGVYFIYTEGQLVSKLLVH
jgi:hypothetical protein